MYKPFFLQRLFGSTPPRPGVPSRAAVRSARRVASICHELQSQRGEVSGAFIAREALTAYQSLDEPALEVFFTILVKEFSLDPEAVGRSAEAYRKEPSPGNLVRLLRALAEYPHWASIETDLADLFRSWFNRGFLVLQRIDWRTSALVLEKLIQYEAVHEIQGWHDLRRRLQADRRCYAFFHPTLPDEPVIFIEVALTRGMSAKVQPLLALDSPVVDPASADCAIFYSITNPQEGLRGISFGNLLIKQVAEDLGREFPRLKTFATLSPIPGFRKWLAGGTGLREGDPRHAELATLLAKLDVQDWFKDKAGASEILKQLSRLCAYYLLYAKQDGEPQDAVARFHLGNGARLERLNWLGDISATGMRRSAGLMVNYLYRLDDVESNHEAYARGNRIIASRRFGVLAKESLLVRGGTPRRAVTA